MKTGGFPCRTLAPTRDRWQSVGDDLQFQAKWIEHSLKQEWTATQEER